jgi:S-adenosylmethionine:tRNA ribosyltransferase-isomerase
MTKRPAQLNPGTVVHLPGDRSAEVVGHDSQTVRLRIDGSLDEKYFDDVGHVPLPPYIKRDDEEADESRYQTIYASTPGSVAAPTAGLHMTGELLREIESRGMPLAFVTLHVGPGTFLPVRSDDPAEHVMHSERYQVTAETANTINGARADGRPIVAVGTTSVRTLESSYDPASSTVGAGQGATNLFIRPGYRFNVVSGLLTNFHTPESTLLMLVCAFAGRDSVLSAYGEAVRHRYRFFSYGDAMYIQ